MSAELASRWTSATDDPAKPLQSVRVDLGPQVGWEVYGTALQLFAFWLDWSPAWFFGLFHMSIVVPRKILDYMLFQWHHKGMKNQITEVIEALKVYASKSCFSYHDALVINKCADLIQRRFSPKRKEAEPLKTPDEYGSVICGDVETVSIRGVIVTFSVSDRELFYSNKWWTDKRGYVMTYVRREDGTRRAVGLHRVIMGDHPCDIDHINRNRSDNTRGNLRLCSRSENCKNIADRKNKSSRFRGVSKSRNKWAVVVRIDGKVTWLGSYATEEEAAAVAAPHFPPRHITPGSDHASH